VGLPDIQSWTAVMSLGGTLISSAVCLAMPVLAVTLCVNLTVGLTTVFSPQMNLLTIGFPLLVLAGLWVMAGSTGYLGHMVAQLMDQGMALLSNMIARQR
jgi:flagellar biosynthetic protein FliR